jgi:hypothetical protein
MPDSKPADAKDIPKPPSGTIPPPPPPNPPPASTNALGNPAETLKTESGKIGVTGAKVSTLLSNITSGKMDAGNTLIGLIVLVWIVFGFAGFVMSLWCLGFSGNVGQKIGGMFFAIILGPFYWLYFYSVPAYCARLPPPSTLF